MVYCLVLFLREKIKQKLKNPSCDSIIIIRLFFFRNRTLSFFPHFLQQYQAYFCDFNPTDIRIMCMDQCHRFRELGKTVFFVTNNSTKHRREYLNKFQTLGFGATMVSQNKNVLYARLLFDSHETTPIWTKEL